MRKLTVTAAATASDYNEDSRSQSGGGRGKQWCSRMRPQQRRCGRCWLRSAGLTTSLLENFEPMPQIEYGVLQPSNFVLHYFNVGLRCGSYLLEQLRLTSDLLHRLESKALNALVFRRVGRPAESL